MSKIKYSTMYIMSIDQMQDIQSTKTEDFIRHQLKKRFDNALISKLPIKQEKTFDRTKFSIDFYLATEEEFWEEVQKEAKKLLNERERHQK